MVFSKEHRYYKRQWQKSHYNVDQVSSFKSLCIVLQPSEICDEQITFISDQARNIVILKPHTGLFFKIKEARAYLQPQTL